MNVRRVALSLAVVAISAGVFGVVGSQVRSDGDGQAKVVSGAEAVSAGPADVTSSYDEIPEEAVDEDGYALPGLEFGFLTKVSQKDGKVRLTVQEAEFYSGKAAATINGGVVPPNSYLIAENDTSTEAQYVLAEDASLIGINMLIDDPSVVERQSITREQLVENFRRAEGQRVPVWVRHPDPAFEDGPVTALAEQYVP
ncbi:hypothetical protein Kisp01_41190 [Kineosporia sp. NBRC 101677]|uniref:hypothetical protein n=1 Tax=Kineosporia sp. NBRC 101677 TaxID=3032197 RepID=UPI0024A2F6BA|nr:hypothetical protein [Kineosporia sp. NBRC 101677]GLY17104.1 hypothetical protein Kisp01_41190 [Kineosporia sp. NBRC 101677]